MQDSFKPFFNNSKSSLTDGSIIPSESKPIKSKTKLMISKLTKA
jgi:hypothetical protein